MQISQSLFILHGDNTTAARSRAVELLSQAKLSGHEVTRVAADTLTLPQLETLLGSDSLFAAERTICIESLHSLPTSKRKTELLTFLSQAQYPDVTMVLLEKRALTATMLKKFPSARAESFSITKALFKWLDTLQGSLGQQPKQLAASLKLLRQAAAQDGEVLCLVMAARQLRLLIQVFETGQVAGPPFLLSKLKKQAATFSSITSLVAAHAKLLELDLAHKSGAYTTYEQDLDLWLMSL